MDKKIEITGVYSDVINFAMQQNHVPVVRQLYVKNIGAEELKNLTVTISSDPFFFEEWQKDISSLLPDQMIELSPISLHLSASYLYGLTEGINGAMFITVKCGDEVLCREAREISLLAYDEWSGANIIPEIIAAFVTPNHPYIAEIVKNAGVLLQKWDGDPSFTGYQRQNPNAVRKQMAAIYGALQQENIAYCMPPASFEEIGQRIRLGGAIKEQKLGTCIDLTLLYASCLEYVGLNPLIVVIKGHAFVCCWLEDECFPECVQDDPSMLTKRMASGINEICPVESTCFVADKNIGFEDAVSAAKAHMTNADDFLFFVDVKRCRGSKIRPLPVRIVGEDGTYQFNAAELENNVQVTDAPKELELTEKLQYVEEIKVTKQRMWERKLLDLSLRNTLLNFRVTKNSIQLLVSSLSQMEDALSSGEEFQIMHCPADLKGGLRDNKIFEIENNESMLDALMSTEFANHRIRTLLDENSLAYAVKSLYRTAKSSMEENGANTLYLAMGFLKWYESDISEKARYAPLILMPIDIVRKSAQKGYVIRVRDEETQFNVTLLEWLRAEFGMTITGLDPLPTDQSGTDINLVFNIVRQAVMGKSRWDVEELAFIGIFSFSQFIMWNDMRNRVEDLKQNKVVASLMSGKMEWTQEGGFPEVNSLDDNVSPLDVAVPVSADSSQMAAICAAGNGNSFVLHGPPGTGKSQTITNMIANALYQGKSVLFIAEKMAALSVVQRRLQNIGLAPFCLELHSNKAKKKEVLSQLETTLNIGHIKNPEEYTEQADRLRSSRAELNEIMNAVHKQRPYGCSLYEAITRAEQYKSAPDCIDFSVEQIHSLTPSKFTEWSDICGELSASAKGCGGVKEHPLKEIGISEYSALLKNEVVKELAAVLKITAELKSSVGEFGARLGAGEIKTYRQIGAVNELCIILSKADHLPAAMLERSDLPVLADTISRVCEAGIRRDELEAELLKAFAPSILEFDAAGASVLWSQSLQKWFIPKMQIQGKIVKSLKQLAINPKSYQKETTPRILALITEYQSHNRVVSENAALFSSLYGIVWNNGKCDWEKIRTIYNQVVSLRRAVSAAAETVEMQNAAINSLKENLANGVEDYRACNESLMRSITENFSSVIGHETALTNKLKLNLSALHNDGDWLAALTEILTRLSENIEGLRDWCAYLQIRNKALASDLGVVVNALESGEISDQDLLNAFYRNIYRKCAVVTIDEDAKLSSFTGTLFEQKIEKFKETSGEFEKLTRQELIARLSANVPVVSNGAAGSSEIGILQRAIRSGGRGMSIRKLFDSIPNLLRNLCPCMLMSPISVAQYIDPKYPKFDLVIFDEASQLPTFEAVGAIARGNNLVVVGDPKQLPPTSFFTANHTDEDNLDQEDLESVLDDCLALSMPQEHLLWHYRSRHESLIAFSNHEYYDNRLYTFPSPNDMVSEVRHIAVEGCYDRGKTKQNRAEAEAVVSEIIRRMKDPVLRKMSMGVVTFSVVQQHLIEDMLDEEFSKNPELDEFNSNAFEPLFVKNLENVQGDERDVILFSIGYGPDKDGRVALNFGPLNRDGGWRRLNVAVSRARRQMLVFSVLRPEQIDLSKTRSVGIAGLKAFLEFAMRGKSALAAKEIDNGKNHGIEEAIAERLRAEGIEVQTNIGCSEYKIDIGLLDPDKPDEYILGILCDGKNYSGSGTARDRNILQESVLKSLGWNIHRVWCLDWWENSDKELAAIKAAFEDVLQKSRSAAQVQEIVEETASEAPDTVEIENLERVEVEECAQNLPTYEVCVLERETDLLGNSEKFANPALAAHIRQQIEQVLAVESPISRNLLCKRVLEAWGISRRGARIDRTFDGIFATMELSVTNDGKRTFYWKSGQDSAQYSEFRVPPANESCRRSIDDIACEEIAAAARYVLQTQFSLTVEELVRQVATLFGFSRCTAPMQALIKQGIELTVEQGHAVIENDRIGVKEQ